MQAVLNTQDVVVSGHQDVEQLSRSIVRPLLITKQRRRRPQRVDDSSREPVLEALRLIFARPPRALSGVLAGMRCHGLCKHFTNSADSLGFRKSGAMKNRIQQVDLIRLVGQVPQTLEKFAHAPRLDHEVGFWS